MIGQAVDRYHILEELGHGGMSVVYRGRDSSLEREVAVKVLHNHLAKKLENRQRFHREAKAIARLRHPNILEVYDFSSEDADRSYIVMEYVAGENLRQYIARTGTPPPEYVALLAAALCDALEHAHDHGIIHRDLKPENVMVSSSGHVKLMDFGIAHVIDAETMTATGSLMGSPAHMAPELIEGEKVDVRADIFGLGTVVYWLATGRLPFEGANAPQVLKRVLEGDYDDVELVDARIGAQLSQIVERCLARSPDDRYPSVVEVRDALVEFADHTLDATRPETLRSYLLAPDVARQQFEESIVDKLLVRAVAAKDARDIPLAIGLFNRILAYAPEHREVQQLLDQLCRQSRWRQRAPYLVGAAVAVAGVAAIISTWPPPPPVDTTDLGNNAEAELTAATEAADRIADTAAIAARERDDVRAAVARASEALGIVLNATSASTVSAEPLRVATVTPLVRPVVARTVAPLNPSADADAGDGEPDVPEEPISHVWTFRVTPAAATLTIDDVPVDLLKASAGIPLTEGMHVVKARSKGARPWVQTINVRGPDTMQVALEWEPGGVNVHSNAPALVWFDGAKHPVQIGKGGRVFPVPFDTSDSSRQIQLRAAPVARPTAQETREVTVFPGNVQPVIFRFAQGG